MTKSYVIELIRRSTSASSPRVITTSDPDTASATLAIKAAQKAYKTRATGSDANGFRVTERESGKVIATWYAESSR
jgi:hypothetical protein